MEKKMETTIIWGCIGIILGLYWENGKEMETTILAGPGGLSK